MPGKYYVDTTEQCQSVDSKVYLVTLLDYQNTFQCLFSYDHNMWTALRNMAAEKLSWKQPLSKCVSACVGCYYYLESIKDTYGRYYYSAKISLAKKTNWKLTTFFWTRYLFVKLLPSKNQARKHFIWTVLGQKFWCLTNVGCKYFWTK